MGSMGQGGRVQGGNMVVAVWMIKMGCDEKQKLHHIYVLGQHGWLRLAVTGNWKLHHIHVQDQHGGLLRWAVIGNKVLHSIHCRPNAGKIGGGRTRTVARDVNVCSQASSLANVHQLAAALPRNTTQAADSVTIS